MLAAKEALDKGEPQVSRDRVEAVLRSLAGTAAQISSMWSRSIPSCGTAPGERLPATRPKCRPPSQLLWEWTACLCWDRPRLRLNGQPISRSTSFSTYLPPWAWRLMTQGAGCSQLKPWRSTGKKCTFACHTKGSPSHPKTNLQIAQENGIRTRIDVIRSVANSLLDDVKAAQGKTVFGPDVYRIGLYGFSGTGVDVGGARTLATPTASVELVRPQIGTVQLDNATAYKPMLAVRPSAPVTTAPAL